jgi:hypothetical protein
MYCTEVVYGNKMYDCTVVRGILYRIHKRQLNDNSPSLNPLAPREKSSPINLKFLPHPDYGK